MPILSIEMRTSTMRGLVSVISLLLLTDKFAQAEGMPLQEHDRVEARFRGDLHGLVRR